MQDLFDFPMERCFFPYDKNAHRLPRLVYSGQKCIPCWSFLGFIVMKYRAEIDGLRAVAVIPVMLFHAGLQTFSGGFVGVDVFFVISGYLITSIILGEIEQGSFSIRSFYDRRARRILPALFCVMLVSVVPAWLWLLPQDMKEYSHSLITVSTFVSNVFFWQETGYWGTANELKPLLHTWSLAVEEQYYLLFPLLLTCLWRWNRSRMFLVIVVIAVMSLGAAQLGANSFPDANFFLLPTRAWELAIGAAIAFGFHQHEGFEHFSVVHPWLGELFGFCGLLLIGYAVFVYDESVPFPSLYGLIPTIGAGLIIVFASSRSLVGRLLGSRLLVGVGLVSYSAYLWHQPVFAFARYRVSQEPEASTIFLLLLLSFLLAYFSWKYVERPFRDKNRVSTRAVFRFSLVGSLCFILLGTTGSLTNGFAGRKTESGVALQVIEKKRKLNYGLSKICDQQPPFMSACRTSDEPEILVWGDSYAMHLVDGILAANPEAKIIQMTKTACGPFFDVAPVNEPRYPVQWAEGCLQFVEDVRQWLHGSTSVKYAVVSSPFTQYLSPESELLSRDGNVTKSDIPRLQREFERTLDELKAMGITPVVFSPPPANGEDIGRCLARADWMGWSLDECNFSIEMLPESVRETYAFLRPFGEKFHVVDLEGLICPDGTCESHINNNYIYRDKGHLSHEGSRALGSRYDFYKMIMER